MGVNNPIYVVVLIAHASCAIIGFGTVALSGYYVRKVNSNDLEAMRYFDSRRIGPRIFVVAAFCLGLLLIYLSNNSTSLINSAWLKLGIADYGVATAVTFGFVWPTEAKLKRALGGASSARDLCLDGLIRRISLGSLIVDLLVSAALILMVTQPG